MIALLSLLLFSFIYSVFPIKAADYGHHTAKNGNDYQHHFTQRQIRRFPSDSP